MNTLVLTVDEGTRLSELIELGTAALIEREGVPVRAVLVDTAPTSDPHTYTATFRPAFLRPVSILGKAA